MNMDGPWRVPQGADGENFYQYNGKDKDSDLGLDWYHYGARIYLPEIGRFTAVDPLAESYSFQSPYVYAANDPITNIDIFGLAASSTTDLISDVWNKTPDDGKFHSYNNDGEKTGEREPETNGSESSGPCPDPPCGYDARQRAREMALLKGEKSQEDFINEMMAEMYGGIEGIAWVSGEFIAIKVFQGGRWIYRYYRIRHVKNLYGGALKATKGKTTTILGKFDEGVESILKTNGSTTGANPGGFNVLSSKSWDGLKNIKWLDDAVQRGDVIRLVSDPKKANGVYLDELNYLRSQYNLIPDGNGYLRIAN